MIKINLRFSIFLVLVVSCLGSCKHDLIKQEAAQSVRMLSNSVLPSLEKEQGFSFSSHRHIAVFLSIACEHCHYQTQALLANHDEKPAGLRLAFIADGHPDSLKVFASKFEYDTTNTKFIWDEESKLAQEMGVTSYPTMFLYDTAGVHLQTIVGEAKPSYVYKFFHDTE